MAEDEKVVVRFESTLGYENDNPQLLSGPIEIFATLDKFDELEDDELLQAILEEYSEKIDSEDYAPNIVVYVKNIFENNKPITTDGGPNRGAYYRLYLEKDENGKWKLPNKLNAITSWQEIALGTHSHINPDALNDIASLPLKENSKNKLVYINNDGKFDLLEKNDASNNIPNLPKDYLDRINEYKKLHDNSLEPSNSEKHHLDAPLKNLQDTYDWLKIDKDGVHRNLAVGTCRDLYYELVKADKKLYLDNKYQITENKNDSICYIKLDAFSIIFEGEDKNVLISPSDNSKYLIQVELTETLFDNDKIVVFDNDKILSVYDSKILKSGNKILNIIIEKTAIKNPEIEHKLTVLVAKDCIDNDFEVNIFKAYENNKFNLYDLNYSLLKLYIEGELFDRNLNLPKLYLATDAYGNIHWENKLLPSQNFYHEKIIIDNEYLAKNKEDKVVNFVFKTDYNSSEDFPLLLINNDFAFDIQPEETTETDKTLRYKIPIENSYSDLVDGVIITLVLVKSSASFINEFAENYITKDDAVAILTHGKISLRDYAKATDLLKFAKLNHTHSEYALRGHNHDYRYAMFNHTHPEIARLIAEIVKNGASEADINRWMADWLKRNKAQFEELIKSLGLYEDNGVYYLSDSDTLLSQDSINAINDYLEKYKDDLGIDLFHKGNSVKDAISLFAKLFEKDTVLDSQVKLEESIRSVFNIGGIKEGTVYERNDDLRKILTDLLNPFISFEAAKEILTPEKIEIDWYKKVDGNYIKIDPERLSYKLLDDYSIQYLYFKITKCLNKNGEECRLYANVSKQNRLEKTKVIPKLLGNEPITDDGEFYKVRAPEFIKNSENTIESLNLEISGIWIIELFDSKGINKITNNPGKLYDNYGLNQSKNDEIPESERQFNQEQEFSITAPLLFYGLVDRSEISTDSGIDIGIVDDNFNSSYLDNPINYNFGNNDLGSNQKTLVIFLRSDIGQGDSKYDLAIKNNFTNNRVEYYFEQLLINGSEFPVPYANSNINDKNCGYYCYSYDIDNSNDDLIVSIEFSLYQKNIEGV